MSAIENRFKSKAFGILLAAITMPAFAQDQNSDLTIKPFGNFTWHDGLFKAITTAQSIAGIEKLDIKVGEVISSDPKITEKQIQAMLSERYAGDMLTRSLGNAKVAGQQCVESKDAVFYYFLQRAEITVSPIIISNVPFTASLEFVSNCGLAIQHPEEVTKDASGKVITPLKLVGVTLTSKSPLLGENIGKIAAAMQEKYKAFPPSPFGMENMLNKNRADASQADAAGNNVQVQCYPENCTIAYRTTNSDVDEAYRKHLADIEVSKNSGKADMSSGL